MKETIQFRPRKNFQIKASQVRLINSDGANLGVMSLGEAVNKAREQGMDVIEINNKAYPIVAKIGDLGKFLYDQKKQQAETKKKQKIQETKTLALHPSTEQFDIDRQIKQAAEFLVEGHRVSFICKMRGREATFPNIAREKLNYIIDNLVDLIAERPPILIEGRNVITTLSPAKK